MKPRTFLFCSTLTIAAALATPTALAQAGAAAQPQQGTTPTASPAQAASPQSGAPAASNKEVTWNDLDQNKDGSLSKTEVAPLPGLVQVFDQVDADKNGQMTPDEYKAFAQAQQGGTGGAGGQSGATGQPPGAAGQPPGTSGQR